MRRLMITALAVVAAGAAAAPADAAFKCPYYAKVQDRDDDGKEDRACTVRYRIARVHVVGKMTADLDNGEREELHGVTRTGYSTGKGGQIRLKDPRLAAYTRFKAPWRRKWTMEARYRLYDTVKPCTKADDGLDVMDMTAAPKLDTKTLGVLWGLWHWPISCPDWGFVAGYNPPADAKVTRYPLKQFTKERVSLPIDVRTEWMGGPEGEFAMTATWIGQVELVRVAEG